MSGELADHLINSQAVILTHVVQESQCMVLEDRMHVKPRSASCVAMGSPLCLSGLQPSHC